MPSIPEKFQSTLPVRGATPGTYTFSNISQISIHAPREGSDVSTMGTNGYTLIISIHAPREGSDLVHMRQGLPMMISIHAPREGSDAAGF